MRTGNNLTLKIVKLQNPQNKKSSSSKIGGFILFHILTKNDTLQQSNYTIKDKDINET